MAEKQMSLQQLKEALEQAAIAVGDVITIIEEASENKEAPAQ
jgi:SHS2 domain-containing protein